MATRKRRQGFTEPDAVSMLIHPVRSRALTLHGSEDLDPLMERIGDARFVLLGEATHGTADFYDWRRTISQRLIREKGIFIYRRGRRLAGLLSG
jgi:erythromycin esterase-like protein